MAPKVLVLESPWTDNLADEKSVRLFIRGWADISNMTISYRMYHDKDDLVRWIERFIRNDQLSTCYIAGHGSGGCLSGFVKGIYPKKVAMATKQKGPGGKNNKGILLGSCDVGSKIGSFLNNCGKRISWVAGYEKTVPWFEGTMCDLMFLEYITRGRIKRNKAGNFLTKKNEYISRGTASAEVAAKWVIEDFPLASKCGFRALDRDRR